MAINGNTIGGTKWNKHAIKSSQHHARTKTNTHGESLHHSAPKPTFRSKRPRTDHAPTSGTSSATLPNRKRCRLQKSKAIPQASIQAKSKASTPPIASVPSRPSYRVTHAISLLCGLTCVTPTSTSATISTQARSGRPRSQHSPKPNARQKFRVFSSSFYQVCYNAQDPTRSKRVQSHRLPGCEARPLVSGKHKNENRFISRDDRPQRRPTPNRSTNNTGTCRKRPHTHWVRIGNRYSNRHAREWTRERKVRSRI